MPPDFDPPFCPGGMLMGTTDRTIDTVLLPVNPTFGIGLLLEGFEHPLPHASFDPSIEAAGHRAPWPIPLWQVSPRRPGSHNPQDGIEDQTMILCWTTHFWLLRWQQGSQLLPLLIRQFSSSHTPFYRLETICKQALALLYTLQSSSHEPGRAGKRPARDGMLMAQRAQEAAGRCANASYVVVTWCGLQAKGLVQSTQHVREAVACIDAIDVVRAYYRQSGLWACDICKGWCPGQAVEKRIREAMRVPGCLVRQRHNSGHNGTGEAGAADAVFRVLN